MLIIIATAISQYSYALEFTLLSPQEVDENQEFEVSVIASTAETYDVKIFVHNGGFSRGNLVSQVYSDGQWKSSWYYLNGVFPQNYIFRKKVSNYSGETQICAQLRKTGETAMDGRICNTITVNGDNGSSNSPSTNNQNQDSDEDEEEEEDDNDLAANQNTVVGNNTLLAKENNQPINQKIVLNSRTQNNEPDKREVTKYSMIRTGVIYSFVGLCVILVVLLAWKKL